MSATVLVAAAFAVLAILTLAAWLHGFLASAPGHWGAVDGLEDMEFEDSSGLPESAVEAARQEVHHPIPMQWKPRESEFGGIRADFRWLGNFASPRPESRPDLGNR